MDSTNPLDIFNEGLFDAKPKPPMFSPQQMADAKARAVEGDRHSPAVKEIKTILNRLIDTQDTGHESWNVMIDVLKAFPEEVRTYIYKQAMK
jgi:peptidoglycan hydrolase-like protein with peptidoglycan-binding domain